jgi:TolB-like protein
MENKKEAQLQSQIKGLSRMLVKSFNYAQADPDTFLQNARKTTETICKFIYNKEIGDEGSKKMMLADYGRALVSQKIIPERIGLLIGTILTYGNYGAHAQDDLSEASHDWIAPCQTALANLSNWFFLDYLKGDIPEELHSSLKMLADKPAEQKSAQSGKRKVRWVAALIIFIVIVALLVGLRIIPNLLLDNAGPVQADDNRMSPAAEQSEAGIITVANEIRKSPDAKRIAVLYFDNSSDAKELDALRKGLADMMITDLSKFYMLQVVEREKLESILKEQDLSNSARFDANTAVKIGKLLGVESILIGGYFELFGSLRLDARIVDVETGKVLKSEGVNGPSDNLYKLEKELVKKIVTSLEVALNENDKTWLEKEQKTSFTLETGILYSNGLDQIDNGNKKDAKVSFEQVLKENPDFEPAHRALEKLSI